MLVAGKLIVFGEQFWRPYVHVRDAARAVLLAIEAREDLVAGQVFNVGSTKENYQKQQIVELIRPHAPSAVVEYVHRDGDPRDYRVSFARIKDRLGFEVTRTVPDGIREIVGLVRQGAIADLWDPRYRN
jgi:nucleoside-diphosphate-sugar epimerase